VCITNGICVFDCIEFNERYRCSDVASEAAFLAVDLDARGRPDLGYLFTQEYSQLAHDSELRALLPFYRCYRAYVRGKVLSFRLDEPEFSEPEQEAAAVRARSYFHLARRYATPLTKPTVVLVAGLSGTGKTALARAIAGELGLRVISADAVRKSIFGQSDQSDGYGQGRYSAEANRVTYDKLLETGRSILAEGPGVVLDATFRRDADRRAAMEMASRAGAGYRLIECGLSPKLVRARMETRKARRESLSDATWATYLHQRLEFEPIDETPYHQVVDTAPALTITSHSVTDLLRQMDM
jgi:predicted kinase